jgi:hypothetical protein
VRQLNLPSPPARLHEYCEKWGKRMLATGSVDDAPRAGRPRAVPKDRVLACAALLKGGLSDGLGHQRHFTSYSEARLAYPLFNNTCAEYGVTEDTLLQAMLRADADLCRRTEEYKWSFTPEELTLRKEIAKSSLDKLHSFGVMYPGRCLLDALVFLDEASVWVGQHDTSPFVWCSKADDRPLLLTTHAGHKFKQHAKWYLAVNPLFGVLGPYFTTGTTGEPARYMVSRGNPLAL